MIPKSFLIAGDTETGGALNPPRSSARFALSLPDFSDAATASPHMVPLIAARRRRLPHDQRNDQ